MRNYSPSGRGQQKWTRNNEGFRIRSPRSKDEELALFHDMRTRENKNFLHPSTDDIETSLRFRISASPTPSWKGNDLLATPDSDKTDYDWLLTPPGTPLFPSLDKDSLQTYMDRGVVTQSHSASKGSRLSGSNTTELHRMSHRSPGPRTPMSTASSTSSSHTFSRARAPSPSRVGSSPTLRPSTPVKTLARSTTTMNRASTRSSPPVLRRANTSPSVRSSSTERNVPPLKGRNSISPKMQAWQAPELGFSAEPPPNLRTSLSDRSSRTSTARPRIGVQEARHHQEARHSYSEAIDSSRQSHWRNSSSSASKLSSSTTSQDRWSSRGSVISSSDDGMDVMEPAFLDFSATSPSSTSGTTKIVGGRSDNEVYSPVVSRQKKSSACTAETAGFSSASARKSLEPSLQRVDHRRVSQNMFRPLLSSAPTTSFCNVGHTVVRHRPANPFAEPSITASSNASSEQGVRIFPGNESSDEEDEVQSEWDQSMPARFTMSKFVLNANDVIDEENNRVHAHVCQYEHESVADNTSCTMDGCETDGAIYGCEIKRAADVNSLDWERIQTSDAPKEDQNCFVTKPSLEGIVHDYIDEDTVCCNTQQANADKLVESNEVVVIPHVLHYRQKEIEICDGSLNFNKPYKADEKNFQEATGESIFEQAVCSPKTHRNVQDSYKAEQDQQIRMNQPIIKSMTNGCISETIPCHESYTARYHFDKVNELSLPVQVGPFKKNADHLESEHGTIAVVQNKSLQSIKENPDMSTIFSGKVHAIENNSASFASIVAGISVSGHEEREDFFHPKSPIIVCQQPSHCEESQGELSSFPSTSRSEIQSSVVCQQELALQASCREYYTDMLEIDESIECKVPSCNSFITPENQVLIENERAVDSESFSGLNQAECSNVCHAINSDSEDTEQLNRTLSHNDLVHASLREEEEQNLHCDARANGLLSLLEIPGKQHQNNEHCQVDSDPSMVPGGESSPKSCLATEASEEEELSTSGDDSTSACFQNTPQPPDLLQPDSSSEENQLRTCLQGALSVNAVGAEGLEDTATHIHTPNTTEDQHQPQRGSPLKTHASPGPRAATLSYSLEEATNTILFCSSIVHGMVYKAASIASEKEVEAMKASAPLVSQSRGQNINTDFISSLRGKVSRSATKKVRHKDAKAFTRKLQKEEVSEVPLTVTEHPTPIIGMDRNSVELEADEALPDNTKEKSFMGMSVNSNCQCTIM